MPCQLGRITRKIQLLDSCIRFTKYRKRLSLKIFVTMKEHFYMVLPSNSSMRYFPDNTATHFVTQLPQPIHLADGWGVALTDIQGSRTLLHV